MVVVVWGSVSYIHASSSPSSILAEKGEKNKKNEEEMEGKETTREEGGGRG